MHGAILFAFCVICVFQALLAILIVHSQIFKLRLQGRALADDNGVENCCDPTASSTLVADSSDDDWVAGADAYVVSTLPSNICFSDSDSDDWG